MSLLAWFSFWVACLAKASPKQSGDFVWTTFVNEGSGWSNGVVFLIGMSNPNFAYGGIDGAIHLAEDAKNAVTAVPWALVTTISIGFITTWPFVVAMFYCINDPDAVLGASVPIFEIWHQAVKSASGATFMTVILLLTGVFALNATQQTASRLTWSFARDRALVFSDQIGHVHPSLGVPVWALLFNAFIVFVIGCIYLGSTTAFNSIVGCALILGQITYAIPAALKMWRLRAGRFLPEKGSVGGGWNLGLIGWLFDFITVAWAIVILIFYCFPTTTPTTSGAANYAAAVLVIMALFGALNWIIYARTRYTGPKVDLEKFRFHKVVE